MRRVGTTAFALAVAGCYVGTGGGVPDGATLGGDDTVADSTAGDEAGDTSNDSENPEGGPAHEPRVWRLTVPQYERTVEAGLLADIDLSALDVSAKGEGFANGANTLLVDEVFFSELEEALSSEVEANFDAIVGQLSCTVAALDDACLSEFLETFTLRVQRTGDADISGYLALFDSLSTQGTREEAIRGVVTAAMLSPKALFRTEIGEGGSLTAFETADFLAYTLWDGPPDDGLLALAADGSLTEAAVLEGEVDRLLAAPGGDDGMAELLIQWVGLAGFHALDKNTTIFPEFDALRPSMRAETVDLIRHVLAEENANLSALLGASYSFVDADLAAFYGLGSQAGRVELPPEERRGVFTHPAVIASMSEPTLTGVVFRGKVLLKRLLCFSLMPPPDIEFPTFDEFPDDATTREKMESIETTQPCAGCHVHLHPPAFAMETYDAIGRYRDLENGSPIDASGTLKIADQSFDFADAPEMFARLATEPAVHDCFVEHAFKYAAGREPDDVDEAVIEDAAERFRDATDVRTLYRDLTLALATADRRSEESDECLSP